MFYLMVTPPPPRVLTQVERKKGFTSIVFVRQAGRTPALGFETVDPRTGKRTGGISKLEFERRSIVGGRKFRGELFVTIPARPKVEVAIRRREEKIETRELAQKEAEFEAGRVARGEIKVKDVVLTQRGSKSILTRLLREQEQKKLRERLRFPTKKERVAETVAKQVFLQTGRTILEKQLQVIEEPKVTIRPPPEITDILLEPRTAQQLRKQFSGDPIQQTISGRGQIDIAKFLTPPPISDVRAVVPPVGTIAALAALKLTLEKAELRGLRTGKGTLEFIAGKGARVISIYDTREEVENLVKTEATALAAGLLLPPPLLAIAAIGSIAISALQAQKEFRKAREQGKVATEEFIAGQLGQLGVALVGVKGGQVLRGKLGIKIFEPKQVKVLKAKELEGEFAETLETEGTTAKNLQRLGLTTETKVRVTRTDVTGFTKRIKTPKDPTKLANLLRDPNVRFELGFDPKTGQVRQFLVRDIAPTVRRFDVKAEPFEIKADGKLGLRLKDVIIRTDTLDIKIGDITRVVDVKDVGRVIDPTLFKKISTKGDFTVLQRDFTFDIDKLAFDVRAELGARAKITGKVKPVKQVADIFGIGLQLLPPQEITGFRPVTTRLGFKPIIGVLPEVQITLPLIFPTREKRKVREPVLDITKDVSRVSGVTPTTISKSLSKQDIISELAKALERRREGRRITKPIVDIDVGVTEAQLPIIDVIPKRKQEAVVDIISISDLVTEQVIEDKPIIKQPPRLFAIKRKPTIKVIKKKKKFIGYNAFAKARKGRFRGQFRKLNKLPKTRSDALSLAARGIDQSISATGKIKEVLSKTKPIPKNDRYFQSNRDKFRTFRIVKGTRVPLKDKIIERRRFRLDTKGEIDEITIARFIAGRRKKVKKAVTSVFGFEEPPRRKKGRRRRQEVSFL